MFEHSYWFVHGGAKTRSTVINPDGGTHWTKQRFALITGKLFSFGVFFIFLFAPEDFDIPDFIGWCVVRETILVST